MAIATVFISRTPRTFTYRTDNDERFACIHQIHRVNRVFPPFLYLLDVPYIIKVTTTSTTTNTTTFVYNIPFIRRLFHSSIRLALCIAQTPCAKWTVCDILTHYSQTYNNFFRCNVFFFRSCLQLCIWFTKFHLYTS